MRALIPESAAMASILVCVLISGAALAEDDCVDAVADWQPRDVLRKQVEQNGWKVDRIKVDDGCYEVRGVDRKGNKFKAKYAPASLRIQKMEIRFEKNTDASDYLLPGQPAR